MNAVTSVCKSLLVVILSCGFAATAGCRNQVAKQSADIDRVEVGQLHVLPVSSLDEKSFAKPDFWLQTRQTIKANDGSENLDVRYKTNMGISNGRYDGPSTAEFLRSVRLATGQSKNIEQTIYVPTSFEQRNEFDSLQHKAAISAEIEISDRTFGGILRQIPSKIELLQDYQTNFVVLSSQLESQLFWQRSSCIRWPSNEMSLASVRPFQAVLIRENDAAANLPSQFYGWLTTSVVYWNDISAESITREQQIALLDWLNYGGLLIVNGPGSLTGLANSNIADELPLRNLRSNQEVAKELTQQLNRFTLPFAADIRAVPLTSNDQAEDGIETRNSKPKISLPASLSDSALSANLCSGTLAQDARWVDGCEGLLAERRVGAGRVCMSCFDMNNPLLERWPSYGSFLHNYVLRLPSRTWNNDNELCYRFGESNINQEQMLSTYSGLQLVTRQTPLTSRPADRVDIAPTEEIPIERKVRTQSSGDASWQNSSPFASLAVSEIKTSSGIRLPPIAYLFKLLCVYLVALVPLNWFVFRIFNRIEWAWFMIPLIAVGASIAIAKKLQIQIGFARSQNAIGLLHLQANYDRALLTRYTSLYTSLSTLFSVSHAVQGGVVIPVTDNRSRPISTASVEYRNFDDQGSGLRRMPIRSHTATILQSEEMVGLDGRLKVTVENNGTRTLENETMIPLYSVVFVSFDSEEKQINWIGDLLPQMSSSLDGLENVSSIDLISRLYASDPALLDTSDSIKQAAPAETPQNLRGIFMALVAGPKFPNQTGLVLAWTNQPLSKFEVSPAAPQITDQTIVCLPIYDRDYSRIKGDERLPPEGFDQFDDDADPIFEQQL